MSDPLAESFPAEPKVVIDEISGLCPVQAEGSVNGTPFYFRSRGARWSMEIGYSNTAMVIEEMRRANPGKDGFLFGDDNESMEIARAIAELNPLWRYEEPYGTWPEAGYITEEEARSFIHKAAQLYHSERSRKASGEEA